MESAQSSEATGNEAAKAMNISWIQKLFQLAKRSGSRPPSIAAISPYSLTDVTNIVRASIQRIGGTAHDDLTALIRGFAPPREVFFKKAQPFITVANDQTRRGGIIVEYNVFNESSITHLAPNQVIQFEQAIARFARIHEKLLQHAR